MKLIQKILVILILISIPCLSINKKISIGEEFNFKSKILNEDRKLMVYLPPDYKNSEKKYPVLYLLDGERHFHYLTGFIGFFSSLQNIPEFIVIAIPNTNRRRDFYPSKEKDSSSDGTDNFLQFLKLELIPFIDKDFRTLKHRILCGHSLTGLFTIYAMIKEPGLFNGYIAASPGLHLNKFIQKLADDFISKKLSKNISLYFTYGTREFKPLEKSINDFKLKLDKYKNKKIFYTFKHFTQNEHGTIGFRTFYTGLENLYKNFLFPFDIPEKNTLKGIIDHYAYFSEKLGYNVSIPRLTFQFVAFDLIMRKEFDEAKKVLLFSIKEQPKSPNSYNLLGIMYERIKDLSESKKAFLKAIELGKLINDQRLKNYKAGLKRIEKKLGKMAKTKDEL